MHYWDTSTLAKLYVSESDSAQFLSYLTYTGVPTISELSRWELFRVLMRKESEGAISVGAAQSILARFLADVAAKRIVLIPLSETVEDRFREVVQTLHRIQPPLMVRTLDRMHIATAALHNAVEFVATDLNMRKCAMALGLKVFP